MGYVEDMGFLSKNGIDVAKTVRLKNAETESILKLFKYPFVMKIEGKPELHKTDVGGVKLIENEDDLMAFLSVFRELKHQRIAKHIIAQEYVKGTELFMGAKRDAQFGPLILFGLGGIFVEIIGEPVIRLAPIDRKEAMDMLKEVKGHEIIEGARGQERVNKNKLINTLVKVSKLITDNEDINELDINPIIGNSRYVKAVDVRIIRR